MQSGGQRGKVRVAAGHTPSRDEGGPLPSLGLSAVLGLWRHLPPPGLSLRPQEGTVVGLGAHPSPG